MWHIKEWMLNNIYHVHDRAEELKASTPQEVRDASHALSNATFIAQNSMDKVRKKADALTALVYKMQGERE